MGGLIPELSLALCSARSSCWSSGQRPPANFTWYLGQQVHGRNNPPSRFSVPGGPLWALDIWPGHTFPTLEHSICPVRKRPSFESVPFTDHKQEESSCRTARRHQDSDWMAAYTRRYRPPSVVCPTCQTLIRQGASHPHSS